MTTPPVEPDTTADGATTGPWRVVQWVVVVLLVLRLGAWASSAETPGALSGAPELLVLEVAAGTALVQLPQGEVQELDLGDQRVVVEGTRIEVPADATVTLTAQGGAEQVLCGGAEAVVGRIGATTTGDLLVPELALTLVRGLVLVDTAPQLLGWGPLRVEVDSGPVVRAVGEAVFALEGALLSVVTGDVQAAGTRATTVRSIGCDESSVETRATSAFAFSPPVDGDPEPGSPGGAVDTDGESAPAPSGTDEGATTRSSADDADASDEPADAGGTATGGTSDRGDGDPTTDPAREPDRGSEPDPSPDPDTDPDPTPTPDPSPEPTPDPGSSPEPDPTPDPGSEPEPTPEPDPDPTAPPEPPDDADVVPRITIVTCDPPKVNLRQRRGQSSRTVTCVVASTGGFEGELDVSCSTTVLTVRCTPTDDVVTVGADETVDVELEVTRSVLAREGRYRATVMVSAGDLVASAVIEVRVR